MTLPTGAPSAVTSKKTLTVAIVDWMGWIRVDSEARARAWSCWRAGAEWSRQSGLASSSNVQLRPPSKIELKSRWLEGWSEETRAEQSSRSGAQGGARMLSWKIHTRKTFAVEQCIRYNVSTKTRLSPPVAKLKIDFFLKNSLGTILAHHDLASPVETEHAAMAGLPTPPSRKISDFGKWQHVTKDSGHSSEKA